MRKSFKGKILLCFVVYEKKGRCFSPSAQKRSFVHSKADCMRIRETEYITRYVQIYMSCSIAILQEFLRNFCRRSNFKLQPRFRLQLRQTSASSFISFVILCISNSRIRKVQISKEKVKVTNISFLPA
jgi:RNase P subunit RPR2